MNLVCTEQFAFGGIAAASSGRIENTYVNHLPPRLSRADGRFTLYSHTGYIVGPTMPRR